MAIFSISSLVAAAGFSQDQTTYSLTWRATTIFNEQWERVDGIGQLSEFDGAYDFVWEGQAEIVRAPDEMGHYETVVASLSYGGTHSARLEEVAHMGGKCYDVSGPFRLITSIQTQEAAVVFSEDQQQLFEQRLIAWVESAEATGRVVMKDPFAADDFENCNPRNFLLEGTIGQSTTHVLCDIQISHSDWTEPADLVPGGGLGLLNTADDLTPVDEEGLSFSKTVDVPFEIYGRTIVSQWEISLKMLGDCELEVPPQYQDVGMYKNRCYDHVPDPSRTGICLVNNIAGWGCEITAASMLLDFAGYPSDPGKLHDFMLEQSLFVGFFYNPVELARKYTNDECTFHYRYVNSFFQPYLANDMLKEIVCHNATPVVVGVDLYGRDDGRPGHYVVVTGREGTRWKINDTSTAKGGHYLDEYEDFIVMGYIAPRGSGTHPLGAAEAEPDLSSVTFLVDDTVEVNVLDQQGNRTGYDSEQSLVQLEIPNSDYSYFGLRHALTGEWHPVGKRIVVIRQAAMEEYRVELEGISNGTYSVDIHCTDRDGTWTLPVEFSGTAKVGSLEALKVEFDPTPGVPVVVNQVDPLIGGAPVEGLEGWFYSDWFGYYSTAFAPWLFHNEHGFIYRFPDSANTSLFIFDNAIGDWWWTGESVYPFLYLFDPPADNSGTDIESAWLFYFEGTKAPRSFGVVTGADAGAFLFFDP